nr:WYL domain-containing protein [Lewinella sp. IMCC34183]
MLQERTTYRRNTEQPRTSDNLSALQYALTNLFVVEMNYTNESGELTERMIEPFALLSTENWLLIAWCRLRVEFRFFRLDRITRLRVHKDRFDPHGMTLQEYFDRYH